ncbi:hypothetical protein NGM10_05660 [Halorussus salilacus]|uniref:DUF7261 family protein n=1 Tax=Halorussus salilacus TaxID=2953750 RepID=UPI00209FF37C|nr:hypothetical protein [Halorussus salilacus]USZ69226.1 hypothetical protein NGM10_05660 [Halorussus salilacus]
MVRVTESEPSRRERAQLVLAAAAVVAVALAPVVVAYVQLGYHADVDASEDYDAPAENADRVLTRAVHGAAADTSGEHAWPDRGDAVAAVRSSLESDLDALRSSRVESGTVYRVEYNRTAAESWRESNCPSGPNRQFGDCEAQDGVVVQERAGETHVLAVAFDVRVTSERNEFDLTIVVER